MTSLIDLYGFLSVLLHGLSLAGQSVVIGSAGFLVACIARPAGAAAPAHDGQYRRLATQARRLAEWSAWATLGVTAAATALGAAVLASTIEAMWTDIAGAGFVFAGALRCAALAACALVARHARTTDADPHGGADYALAALAAVVLGAALATSHAAARPDDRPLLLAATALHELGAGLWLGGLPCFYTALGLVRSPSLRSGLARRFSQVAMTGVGMIALGAAILVAYYVGSTGTLYGTSYGAMVVGKLVFLGLLLALGFANWRLCKRFASDGDAAERVRSFVELEMVGALATLMLAASLTSSPPAADIAESRVTLQEIGERLTPRAPRLSSPDPSTLALSELQARLEAAAKLGTDRRVLAYSPGSGELPPRNAQDIAWSEYNHHGAGLVLVVIALVALLERAPAGRGRWARHWPLLFIVLAVFIFLRADPEVWPLGPVSFLASLKDPEVLQHRAFAGLIAAFGAFEWRVRTGRFESDWPALAFPALVLASAILLLTHSHAIGNVKDETLIEISHLPMSVLGVIAGAARWLELRGSEPERRWAGLVWPLALLAIGLLLLGYREA